MANVLKRARKLLKKVAVKAADSPLGRQVMKNSRADPQGVFGRDDGAGAWHGGNGALTGAGVWAKGAIKCQVRKHTGRPYRMFGHDFPQTRQSC